MYRLGRDLPYTIVRISRGDVARALAEIDALWRRLVPGVAVSRRFVDEIYAHEYAQHARVASAMTALCGFAVLIAIIGLTAMTQVVVARRAREIAVLKILGAKTPVVVAMLLKGFALLILTASLVAWPAAFVTMQSYLARFAKPIDMNVALFLACFLGLLAVAVLTVGGQILRAARARPSEGIRHE